MSARAAASAGDNLTDAWRVVASTLAAKPDASVLIAGGTPSVGVFVAMHAAATGAIDPLPVYSHEVAWDDAPTALAESPDKPIVERERLLTSPG